MSKHSVERIHPQHFRSKEKYLLYLRHEFAYDYVIGHTTPEDMVLEVGCGDGYGTRRLAGAVAQVVAIDVDGETIAHATTRHGGEGCRFEHYGGLQIPYPDHTFDLVVALQVIEHVADAAHFVAEAQRVLRPGGCFLVTTPNRTYRVPPGQPIWNKYHLHEYYPREFQTVLEEVFSEVRVRGIRGDEESQRIEIERVRRGWSLRKIIPERLKRWIDSDVQQRYSLDNFYVTETQLEESLDLLGVCVKRS